MARSWAEIDPEALRSNLGAVRRMTGEGPGILAVVKANAYGHGTAAGVRALAGGVAIFGVANVSEAREVVATGTGRDVMVLSPCLPAEREAAVREGFIVTVSSAAEALAYARHGAVRVNFKIDTGMGRAGVWWEAAAEELKALAGAGNITIHSVATHLPVSDEDEAFTRSQLGMFQELLGECHRIVPGVKVHALNSAGILRFPEFAGDIVRAGLMLYGISPLPEFQKFLRPALTWKARIALVRELPRGAGVSYGRTFIAEKPMRVALLPVGYADGFLRSASGSGAAVLIGGARCAVIGRVTMDQIVVDLEAAEGATEGDEAVIIGRQGEEEITASELARRAGTIPWEIFTGIKPRVLRVYPGETGFEARADASAPAVVR